MILPRVCGCVCFVVILTGGSPAVLAAGLDAQRLVARKSIELLPDPIAPLFRLHLDELQERTVEPDTVWRRDKNMRDRLAWHQVAMDIEATEQTSEARMAAARRFPRDRSGARRLYGRLGKRASGELLWVIEDYYNELAQAFRSGQEADVIRIAGYLMHFAADTCCPFNASANHEGRLTGNLHLGRVPLGHPHYAHRTVGDRFAGELVRRNRSRYSDAIKMSPGDYDPVNEAAGRARAALLVSLGVLDQITTADAAIIELMGITTGDELLARADEYYQLLDDRCGDICLDRLRDGAVFAANLIAGAWIAGGEPSIEQIRRRGPPEVGQTAELTAAETETPNPEDGGAIVGSSNSRVYHYYNCVFAKKIAPENLVVFKSVAEAKAQGRRPCRVCLPP